MALLWQQEELPSECAITPLATSLGNPEISAEQLPIQLFEASIVASIEANSVTALKAETGSGKTMKGPEYLFRVVDRRPVLIVEKSCFAAASVHASLSVAFGWRAGRLHLSTGQHKDQADFEPSWTQLSIITYGVLFKWFFS